MIRKIIVDTGVIVALLDRREQYHEWAKEQAKNLPTPYLTCEAVITEACFLLQNVSKGEEKVLSLVASDVLQIDFSLSQEIENIINLKSKYKNVPMALADACLVRLSEIENDASIFTLDSDFHIYRKNGKQKIPLVIPK